jgi:hypothetical protein
MPKRAASVKKRSGEARGAKERRDTSRRVEELERQIETLEAELVAKEGAIVQLKEIAEDRLRLIETLNAEATHERYLREALERQLEEKEQMIGQLATAADERLQFIHELSARQRK